MAQNEDIVSSGMLRPPSADYLGLAPSSPESPSSIMTCHSKGPFDKRYYSTIETGRLLEPLNYGFADQEKIAAHFDTLTSMYRTKFTEVRTDLCNEQERYKVASEQFTLLGDVYENGCTTNDARFWYCDRFHPHNSTNVQKRVLRLKKQYWVEQCVHAQAIIDAATEQSAAPHVARLLDATNMLNNDILVREPRPIATEDEDWPPLSSHSCYEKPTSFDKEFLSENAEYSVYWGRFIDKVRVALSKSKQQEQEAYENIQKIRAAVSVLRKEEVRCAAAFQFAKSLSILKSPFRFFELPRETRNQIYSQILAFSYHVAVTKIQKTGQYYWGWLHTVVETRRVWTHPIFQTNQALRKEAGMEFYKMNSFAVRSFATLSPDLGVKILAKSFLHNIRLFSISWQSFGRASVTNAKALKALKGLQSLIIYLNWDQLRAYPRNSLDGIFAFQSLIHLPNPKLPQLQKVQIFEVQLTRKENMLQTRIATSNERTSFFGTVSTTSVGMEWDPFQKEESELDELFSRRLLRTQNPDTVYSNGREPYNPSVLWPKQDAKEARKASRKHRVHAPVAASVDVDAVEQHLGEIISTTRERRERRVAMVAARKAEIAEGGW